MNNKLENWVNKKVLVFLEGHSLALSITLTGVDKYGIFLGPTFYPWKQVRNIRLD